MSGFIYETKIKTSNGIKQISEINKDDLLISGISNNIIKVLAIYKYKINTRLCGFNDNNFCVFTHCFIKENDKYSYNPDLSIHLKHWDKVYNMDNMTISEQNIYEVYNLVTEDHSYIANNYSVSDDFFQYDKYVNETNVFYNVIKEISETGLKMRIDQYIDKYINSDNGDINHLLILLQDPKLMEIMKVMWRDYLKNIFIFHKN